MRRSRSVSGERDAQRSLSLSVPQLGGETRLRCSVLVVGNLYDEDGSEPELDIPFCWNFDWGYPTLLVL